MPSLLINATKKLVLSRHNTKEEAVTALIAIQPKSNVIGSDVLHIFSAPSMGDKFNPLLSFAEIGHLVSGALKTQYPEFDFQIISNPFQLEVSIGFIEKHFDEALRTDLEGNVWKILPSKRLIEAQNEARERIQEYMCDESEPFKELCYPAPRIEVYINPAAIKQVFFIYRKDPTSHRTYEPQKAHAFASWPIQTEKQATLNKTEE